MNIELREQCTLPSLEERMIAAEGIRILPKPPVSSVEIKLQTVANAVGAETAEKIYPHLFELRDYILQGRFAYPNSYARLSKLNGTRRAYIDELIAKYGSVYTEFVRRNSQLSGSVQGGVVASLVDMEKLLEENHVLGMYLEVNRIVEEVNGKISNVDPLSGRKLPARGRTRQTLRGKIAFADFLQEESTKTVHLFTEDNPSLKSQLLVDES